MRWQGRSHIAALYNDHRPRPISWVIRVACPRGSWLLFYHFFFNSPRLHRFYGFNSTIPAVHALLTALIWPVECKSYDSCLQYEKCLNRTKKSSTHATILHKQRLRKKRAHMFPRLMWQMRQSGSVAGLYFLVRWPAQVSLRRGCRLASSVGTTSPPKLNITNRRLWLRGRSRMKSGGTVWKLLHWKFFVWGTKTDSLGNLDSVSRAKKNYRMLCILSDPLLTMTVSERYTVFLHQTSGEIVMPWNSDS